MLDASHPSYGTEIVAIVIMLHISPIYDCQTRLLRDSHLDLEIETLKENSHLILNLDSQFCCENSHSHSQLSFSKSQKFETSRLNLVDFSGSFSNV